MSLTNLMAILSNHITPQEHTSLSASMLSYLHRIKVTWILVHQVRPPQLHVYNFEDSRWCVRGGHTVAIFVHQSNLQGGCCSTLNRYFVSNKT